MRLRIVLFALVVFSALVAPAWSQTERVLDFFATIFVESDGSLRVSESITVQAGGGQIKHGIVREFPTSYRSRSGTVRVGFELLEVLRDGRPEPYHTERRSNGTAIYAGSKELLLSPGKYSYTITYKTTRQLGFFADHDELYWNVNGNGWRLPLDRVGCEVHLPGGATVNEAVIYEGPQGSTEQRRFPGGGSSIVLTSSRPYAPGEGLTIAVAWPKGFVAAPTAAQRGSDVLTDNAALVPTVAGVVVLLVYYLFAWFRVGRDPARGVIIPRFGPPKDFSPAMVRMLWRMGFDDTAFTAGIVSMAVKRALRIVDKNGTTLELADQAPADLSRGEQATWNELGRDGRSVVLKNTNHQIVSRARQAMKDKLRSELAATYFVANSGWVAPGIAITLAAMAGLVWAMPDAQQVLFLTIWLTLWTFGCVVFGSFTGRAWRVRGAAGKMRALFQSFFFLPFLVGELVGLVMLAQLAGIVPAMFLLIMMGLNPIFYELLKAPTLAGRRVLDEIEGFRLYLSVAEEQRLNFLHPPEDTPALFEKFLPYALALGVENAWGKRFAAILSRAGYAPDWYVGSHWSSALPGTFASRLGSGLDSAVSSAATAPGSSSGMNGGSSGGGGGGGGGGGW